MARLVRAVGLCLAGTILILSCGGDTDSREETAPVEAAAPAVAVARSAPVPAELHAAFVRAVQESAPESYRLWADSPERARGDNPAHSLGALFEDRGVTLSSADTAWELSLATHSIGCESTRTALARAAPSVLGNRVEYARAGGVEWYSNGPLGVEQGFAIHRRPACSGVKSIDLEITGDLRAELVDQDGDGRGEAVALRDRGGSSTLRYGDLSVVDAAGARLPAWLALAPSPGGARLSIVFDDQGAAYPLQIDPLITSPIAKLTAPDGQLGDRFGNAVAISRDTAIIGAWTDDNSQGNDAGAGYVFVRSGGSWTFQAKLLSNDIYAGLNLGASVALSGDTALLGAPGWIVNNGAAYVFVRNGVSWSQQAKVVPADPFIADQFGASVALVGDTALIGAPNKTSGMKDGVGAVYFYSRSGAVWTQQQKLLPPLFSGPFGFFGRSVGLSASVAAVGWPWYDPSGSGQHVGQVEVYSFSGNTWVFQDHLLANDIQLNDHFGDPVAVSGTTVVVGVPDDDNAKGVDAGEVLFFRRTGGVWVQEGKLFASDGAAGDHLGVSVAVSGDTALIGAFQQDNAGGVNSGSAYVFLRSGAVWSEQAKLVAADGATNDEFGFSVGVSPDTALVGAWGASPMGASSGAAYLFGLLSTNGDACSTATQCQSGSCVDGVCCNNACGGGVPGDCQACSVATGAAVNGTCGPLAAGTTCRVSAGACDAAEACNGVAVTCPADVKVAAGIECRASAGACDSAEACDGSSDTCPADVKSAAGTPCRAAAGACDAVESCNGSSNACPADTKVAAGTPCRASAGACDGAEACDGATNACPLDTKVAAGVPCLGRRLRQRGSLRRGDQCVSGGHEDPRRDGLPPRHGSVRSRGSVRRGGERVSGGSQGRRRCGVSSRGWRV